MKEHAKDYLKEFAKYQDDWLKALIYDVIETNGNIAEDRINEIFNNLAYSKNINIKEPSSAESDYNSEIILIELNHKNGVNALIPGQKIKFSKNVTILYGMNGSGKSSYFKILNEIAGGNKKKEILPNIYLDIPQPIEVELIYEDKKKKRHTLIWNGNERGIKPFNVCKVFDTSYLDGLLQIRSSDETVIQPLGLNLFSYIASLIDSFKEKLKEEADKIRSKKPILNLELVRDEIKIAFERHIITDDFKSEVEKLYNFSSENQIYLEKKEKELNELKQINIQDKIKLETNKYKNIEAIKNHIDIVYNTLKNFITETKEIIKEYIQKKQVNDKARSQFEVFANIPGTDSPEWKDFIKAGIKYSDMFPDSYSVCPYCRQPLKDENSLKLIKAYAEFLKDESEQKLNEVIQEIENKLKKIEKFQAEILIDNDIKKILAETECEEGKTNLYDKIQNILENFKTIKILLIGNLRHKNIKVEINLPNIKSVIEDISEVIKNIESKIEQLSAENSEKQKKIEELESEVRKLKENQSISKQKDNIQKWLNIHKIETELRKKANSINTTHISKLSKQAHNELLTEKLKKNFEYELKEIGYINLGVKLEPAGSKKGISHTKLTIIKNNDLKAILSEGEQKAVGLALFIAECRLRNTNNPIIFDDPVNSLDHKIAANFANRLLKLNNQIIVFTHNKLFLDAFETNRENHICKNYDGGCNNSKGKHIYLYLILSNSKTEKGVITIKKEHKAKTYINNAKNLLNKPTFNESEVGINIRKAIECLIDEKIFNNQVPIKFSSKNNRIHWDELKKLNTDDELIDKLKRIHDRVSGGSLHNGTELEENPIGKEEFNYIINILVQIEGGNHV